MRVQAIQSSNYHYNKLNNIQKQKMTNPQTLSFKSENDGPALYGLGAGLITGLVAVCAAPVAIPAFLGALAVAGTGAAGMGLGIKFSNRKDNDKEDGSGSSSSK